MSSRSSISNSSRRKFNFSSKALLKNIKSSSKKNRFDHSSNEREDNIFKDPYNKSVQIAVERESVPKNKIHDNLEISKTLTHQNPNSKQKIIRFKIDAQSDSDRRAKSSTGFKRGIKERINIMNKANKKMNQERKRNVDSTMYKRRKIGTAKIKGFASRGSVVNKT